jgi:hypothetical protein
VRRAALAGLRRIPVAIARAAQQFAAAPCRNLRGAPFSAKIRRSTFICV